MAGSFPTSTRARSSYAGTDVSQMALTLVNEQADEVVAKLYGDYCRNAGLPAPPRPRRSKQTTQFANAIGFIVGELQ